MCFSKTLTPRRGEPSDELKKLFNIHSGGGAEAMRLQVQTFKTLADFANFGVADTSSGSKDHKARDPPLAPRPAMVRIDFHLFKWTLPIHLPENKTTREYEAIIQDIAKYIYGREIDKA